MAKSDFSLRPNTFFSRILPSRICFRANMGTLNLVRFETDVRRIVMSRDAPGPTRTVVSNDQNPI